MWFFSLLLGMAFSLEAISAEPLPVTPAVAVNVKPAVLKPPTFRLHLAKEPTSLDPQLQNSSAASYIHQNLFRNIFSFKDDKGLIPDLGQSCKRPGPLVIVCTLKKNLHWSDGTLLTSVDFLTTYQRLLNPKLSAPRAELLFKIKNAVAIYKGQKKMTELGISAPDALTLRFELSEKDPEFEYSLSNYLLAPIKNEAFAAATAKTLITSGPYKVATWIAGERIILKSNIHYDGGKNSQRPQVEFLFIPEDSVALQLYEKGDLSFLRRLPSLYIPTFKKRADFLWVPVTRFDYIGFGPSLSSLPDLREALTYSLNYQQLQKIFSSDGTPGCPGIPERWTEKELCYTYDLSRAKAAFKKLSKILGPLKMIYSVQGGEDHRRATEWLQSQWLQNLNLQVQTVALDNKMFLTELQTTPPALFRKGATPDRPTCLAALEIFSENNPENYLRLKDPHFESLIKALSDSPSKTKTRKLCTQTVEYLMNQHWLIPTGRIHFAMLAKPEFKGWNINTLNQLDLAGLEVQNK